MSYSRTYHETVYGSRTVTVHYDYPASENGGSGSESVTVDIEIPVTIDIDVDTNPFDRSISSANRQCKSAYWFCCCDRSRSCCSKIKGSKAVADTIIEGFFGLIKSEINQQLTEIKPKVEALLVEMLQHQESCVLKKNNLKVILEEYPERYSKIFLTWIKNFATEFLLNQSAVGVHGTLTTRVHRSFSDISSGVATIYNKEGSYHLQSMLFATSLKTKALSLIESAKIIYSLKNLSAQLHQILSQEEKELSNKANSCSVF